MPRPKGRETGNEDMHDDLYDEEEDLAAIVEKYRPNFKSNELYRAWGIKIDKLFKDGES